jgi:hypothetical protein
MDGFALAADDDRTFSFLFSRFEEPGSNSDMKEEEEP